MRGGGLVPVLGGGARDEDKHKAPSPLHHGPLSLRFGRHLQKPYPCKTRGSWIDQRLCSPIPPKGDCMNTNTEAITYLGGNCEFGTGAARVGKSPNTLSRSPPLRRALIRAVLPAEASSLA